MSAKELAQIAKNHNWVHEVDEYFSTEDKKKKQALPDPSGLDAGISFEEVDNEEILKKLSDKEKEVQDLKEEFEKLLEKLPIARLPRINSVVVPEFNMPGGRSRFFRYIWNLGTGS
jgi:hypothetical protein